MVHELSITTTFKNKVILSSGLHVRPRLSSVARPLELQLGLPELSPTATRADTEGKRKIAGNRRQSHRALNLASAASR